MLAEGLNLGHKVPSTLVSSNEPPGPLRPLIAGSIEFYTVTFLFDRGDKFILKIGSLALPDTIASQLDCDSHPLE